VHKRWILKNEGMRYDIKKLLLGSSFRPPLPPPPTLLQPYWCIILDSEKSSNGREVSSYNVE
jgi:hypothetical protein